MKSFDKKDSLIKKRETSLKKKLKKKKKIQIISQRKKWQFYQINGLKKQPSQKG